MDQVVPCPKAMLSLLWSTAERPRRGQASPRPQLLLTGTHQNGNETAPDSSSLRVMGRSLNSSSGQGQGSAFGLACTWLERGTAESGPLNRTLSTQVRRAESCDSCRDWARRLGSL